ncbi:fatty-acid amide hydrolase 2-B isoform X2 [Folsomia candida]|uniref:fatty-acid amide hydrolase 2-B isoform X2 n=1 Tax=Folsomia candida TaxID=158441 RepID=UPI000B906096|nr:fatty-acid amide hydrolase 2-B isoform X2 [Folsomia candida]
MEESTSWSITNIGRVVLQWYCLTWLSVVNAALGMLVASIFRLLFWIYDIIGSVILAVLFKFPAEKNPLPPIGNRKFLRQSVTEIADQIRRREITSEEVVRAFIGRIEEVNNQITALVDERFDLAIEEARKVDKLIQSGEYDETELQDKFPLLGVPFTIKDSFCVAGLKHTAGLHLRKEITAPQDADVVKSLKRVGAIPLGVTNVSELCMWWESVNTVYGRSKNPYDTRHITGGSSGGEGALQACAGSAFGVGSDIAGSIRMPSFFCGLFGHKPSTGLISNWGQVPETFGRLAELLTTGPMVRHARDMRLLLDVMLGDNIKKINKVPEMKQMRVLYMVHDGGSPLASPVNDEMQDCVRRCVQHLEYKYGVKPQKVNIIKLYHSLEIWAQTLCGAGAVPFCEELALKQGKVNPFLELIKFFFNASPHTFPAIVLGLVEKVAYVGTKLPRHQNMIEMGNSFVKEFQELMSDDAIFIYPSHPTAAPRHHEPWLAPADFSYCGIFNVLGVPVTQVPMGLGSKGLPIGVQVVGGINSDHLTIKVAEELEAAFGGWVPPS